MQTLYSGGAIFDGERMLAGHGVMVEDGRVTRVAPAAEQAPELAAGMHDVMHRRADPGIGPFAGSPASGRPKRDQP